MKTFDWKEHYYDSTGGDLALSDAAYYYSLAGRKTGTGKRYDPFNPSRSLTTPPIYNMILGGGYMPIVRAGGTFNWIEISGSGIDTTFLDLTLGGATTAGISGVTLKRLWGSAGAAAGRLTIVRCFVDDLETDVQAANLLFVSCIINKTRFTVSQNHSNCTFLNQTDYRFVLQGNSSLIISSDIKITQTELNNKKANYFAFDRCRFLIGNETNYTPLVGVNADELRANFVTRCTAQGLTVPPVTDYGQTLPVGRWVFSNTSTSGYSTLEGSEVDLFAQSRFIYFGHTKDTFKSLPITAAANIPNSFAPANPQKGTSITENSISLSSSNATIRDVLYADSKIIWLGGRSKVSALNILSNFPTQYGFSLDNTDSLGSAVNSGEISDGVRYLVRSTNDQKATVKYNNVEYNSSLFDRNNVFFGASVATFEDITGNSLVLPVIDMVNHNTVQMRIVDEIPAQKITAGSLQVGYWYIVIPNDLSDQTGTITYKGVVRPCFDSFVAVDTTAIAVSGNCHLRRCWHKDFNFATETTDKAFWTAKQKPNYFDVTPNDLRCFKQDDAPTSIEMKKDVSGNYIASGHVDFYNGLYGVNGIKTPAYDITGTFMQIRLPISTLNPM